MKKIRLSVLDQSPIRRGSNAREALQESVQLVRLADELGYTRYWLSEHHNTTMLAGSAPEVLIARLANESNNIRLGSGGIMLPNHSALKVAENFRMLEALYPQRIDLGIGRAPGGDRMTNLAMGQGQYSDAENFPEQVQFLVAYLDDALPDGHPYGKVKAQPAGPTSPQVWLLGSSDYSGALAAHLGLRFAFSHFISGPGGDTVMREYKHKFEPSARETQPCSILTV